ncbi:Mu transposase C-terminal domain-containing protein [Deinococcus sp.]|uniref:Mu transposase C-terminal domain-containing protein n=1 Tax=Deinococcus sp. TaxID=47478 RepID=UPI0025C68169|nr:Mu transposase C-terminal domain-containing protein [Deinococcus sp.]
MRIVSIHAFGEVQVRREDGTLTDAPVEELTPVQAASATPKVGTASGFPLDSPEHARRMEKAKAKLVAVQELLALGSDRSSERVARIAADNRISVSTLYRWEAVYRRSDSVDALVRPQRSDRNRNRTSEEVEALIERVINAYFLTRERPTQQSAYQRLRDDIDRANRSRVGETPLQTPHFATFRRRLLDISAERRVSRRYGPKAGTLRQLIISAYPGAISPHSVAQIDHTPIDLILVDQRLRQPLGRAFLTLIMDVYSRMVLGFSIGFEAPSSYGVGMAISQAILPKRGWLVTRQQEVDAALADLRRQLGKTSEEASLKLEWPCWGKPDKLFMDNAREFDGKMLHWALDKHGIVHEFRPVGRPKYGGHIERLLGTFSKEIQSLPGSTFSNTQARGDYDAEGRAVMTLDAFETWLTAYILGVYHRKVHSELGVTPLEAWKNGLTKGTADAPARGHPELIMGDEAERLRRDFLPSFERTVTPAGVTFEGVTYVGEALARHLPPAKVGRNVKRRKVTVHYDPWDMSGVLFLDPDLDTYFPLRSRQLDFPGLTLWELRAARRFARKNRMRADDDLAIMQAYRVMREVQSREEQATRGARLESEKRRRQLKKTKEAGSPVIDPPRPPSAKRPALAEFQEFGDIRPFDDVRD